MDVSIIMPCYNGDKYIEDTLKSVFQQCTESVTMEVLLLDDASCDNTLSIVKEFIDTHTHPNLTWQLISNIENRGQGVLRNEGMKMASGHYLFFMDSDDIIGKEMLETLFKSLRRAESEPDIIQFEWAFFDDSTYKVNYSQPTPEQEGVLLVGDECEDLLKQAIYYPVNRLYKRGFLLENEIVYGEGYIYEDFEFFAKMATKAETVLISKSIFYYVRLHKNSTTGANRKTSKHFDDFFKAIEQTLKVIQPRKKASLYHVLNYFLSKSVGYAPRFPEDLCDKAILNVMSIIKSYEEEFIIPKDEPKLEQELFCAILKDSHDLESVRQLVKKKKQRELPLRVIQKIKREIKSEKVWIYQ